MQQQAISIEVKQNVGMDTLPLKPERMAALEQYALQHGKNPAEVLDNALAKYLDYENWFAQSVAEGLKAANRGDFMEAGDVLSLINQRYPD